MLLCKKIDLDLEDIKDVYVRAKETVAYLNDIVNSINARVLKGEEIDGLIKVAGKKRRKITKEGEKYLIAILGDDAYKVTKKFIGITDLEKKMSKEDIVELHTKGVVGFVEGSPSVKVV